MNLKKYQTQLLLIALMLSTCMFSTHAATPTIKTTLLNHDAGSPADPKNIKLNITLPESYGRTSFNAEDFNIYIYPQALDVTTGKRTQYHAEKVLLWQHNNQLFIDIRKPPQQRSGGEHTLYVEIAKNKRSIYKAELPEKVRYDKDEADVILVIDKSLSMHSNDPYRNRLRAAKAFVDIARSDKRIRNIGIISFNNKATVVAKMTPVRNSRRLHKAIDSIDASGQTDIGIALESGLSLLDFVKSKRTAIVLLTDGKNESSVYKNQHLELAKRGIPVYCIGLSDQADTTLLKRIAEDTDASFFKASTDNDLLGIYQRIASVISRREVVFNKKIPYNTDRVTIPVDNSIKDISFMLNASTNEVIFTLISPTGKTTEVTPSKDKNFSEIRINKPEAGLWTALLANRASKRIIELNVTGNTSLYLDAFPPLQADNKVWLSGTLADDGDVIQNSKVQVISQKGRIKLYDDGKHNDGKAQDGIYTCSIPVEREFELELLMRAWGTKQLPYIRQTNAGTLKRQAIKVEAPKVRYDLKAENDLIFDTAVAGQRVSKELALEYTGIAKELTASFTSLDNSIYKIDPENLKLNEIILNEGKNTATISLNVPAQMPDGEYSGSVKLATADTDIIIPISIKVLDAELRVENDTIELGYIDEDKLHNCKLDIYLQAPHAEQLSIKSKNPEFEIIADNNLKVRPNIKQSVEFSIRGTNLSLQEEQNQEIILQTGDLKKVIALTYLLAPKSKKQETILFTHELSLPQPSKKVATVSLTHEMSLPTPTATVQVVEPAVINPNNSVNETPEPKLTIAPKEVTPLVETPVLAKINTTELQAMEKEESFLLLLIITATIALSIILLILRKLSDKRMVRFALLSATLHLPIIAIIASYVLVTRDAPTVKIHKAPITNMIVASSPTSKSYIEDNNKTLQCFNNDSTPTLSEFEPNTVENTSVDIPEDSELDITTALVSSIPNELPKLDIDSINTYELNSEEKLVTNHNDFDFNKIIAQAPSKQRPEINTNNNQALQNEINRQAKPTAPLDEIFASIETTTSETKPVSEANANALSQVIEEDLTVTEEIDNILNSTEAETMLAINNTAHKIEPTTISNILPDLEIPTLQEMPDNTQLSQASSSSKLSRDLHDEIDQTSLLRSLTHQNPATEEPTRLLASIDKTAPIEIEEEFDLSIPTEDLPEELTTLKGDIFSDSVDEAAVISEITPRRTTKLIRPKELNSEPVESIPGITSNGLCLDLESINESFDISRERLEEEITPIATISPATPDLDDLKLDTLVIEDEVDCYIPLAVEQEEDSNILEQEIEIPSQEALNVITEIDSKPSVIESIDTLDINIDRKISRLNFIDKAENNHNTEIKREVKPIINTSPKAETYIPSKPNIEKISAAEKSLTTKKTTEVNELSPASIAMFDISDSAQEFSDSTPSDLPISKHIIQDEPAVKIINSPKRLKNTITSDTELLKLPQSLQGSNLSSTDSGINEIALNIGLLSSKDAAINSNHPNFRNVKLFDLSTNSNSNSDILSCQLVITNKSRFTNSEIELLKDYLTSGGHLWIQDQGIPEEFLAIGKIKPIEQDDTLFNSTYEVGHKHILFAEELAIESRRTVIATGCRDENLNQPLLTNVFTNFFGDYQEDYALPNDATTSKALSSYTWQNFTGIDESNIGWNGPKWGNTVTTGIAPNGKGGEALRVAIQPGREDITSVNYIIPDHEGRRIDLSSNTAIILDIFNASKRYVGVSLGLTTESKSNGWNEFETSKLNLKAGWNRGVVIPLVNFRSRRDPEGGYIHKLAAANNCARVSLYFSNIKEGGNLLVDNIKWAEPKISTHQ